LKLFIMIRKFLLRYISKSALIEEKQILVPGSICNILPRTELLFASVHSIGIFNERFDLDYVIWEIIVEWLLLMMMRVIVIMVPALNIFFH